MVKDVEPDHPRIQICIAHHTVDQTPLSNVDSEERQYQLRLLVVKAPTEILVLKFHSCIVRNSAKHHVYPIYSATLHSKIRNYGVGWNGVGAASYLGAAGQGVTGLLHGDKRQFVGQLFGATLCAVWAFGATYGVFRVVNKLKSMRVTPEVEREGLDVPEFGLPGYPEDFPPPEALAPAEA